MFKADFLLLGGRFRPGVAAMIQIDKKRQRKDMPDYGPGSTLLWQYYLIPLYAVDLRRTVHWDKFGVPDFEPKYLPAFPDGWWYDPEKAARIVVNN